MQKHEKIYVAGHRALVGSAIVRRLRQEGYGNLVVRSISELDLREQQAVREFFATEKPDYVILAAARVGGILANETWPADFLYDNLMMEANVIHASYESGVRKLLALGSTCIYPKMAPQSLKEEYLLSGPLEPTNEWYAVAKTVGIKLCQAYQRQHGCRFTAAMPTNLYGPGDNFDLETSHVLPAMIRKFQEAKEANASSVGLWGTAKALREFLHVDDLAEACLFLMQNYDDEEIVNIGVGKDISIADLAGLVRDVVGFEGRIEYDTSKPDGTPRKLVDTSKINALGWKARIGLREGVEQTYRWYLEHIDGLRGGDGGVRFAHPTLRLDINGFGYWRL